MFRDVRNGDQLTVRGYEELFGWFRPTWVLEVATKSYHIVIKHWRVRFYSLWWGLTLHASTSSSFTFWSPGLPLDQSGFFCTRKMININDRSKLRVHSDLFTAYRGHNVDTPADKSLRKPFKQVCIVEIYTNVDSAKDTNYMQ